MKLSALAAGALLAGVSSVAFSAGANAMPQIAKSSYLTSASAIAPVKFEIFLPLRNTTGLQSLLAAQQDKTSPSFHKWLTPAQFKTRFGPTADSVARVTAALKAQGLAVSAVHSRSVEVTGTVAAVNKMFSTSLLSAQPVKGAARMVAARPLAMPAALKAEGAVIPSFAGLLPKIELHQKLAQVTPENRYGPEGPYWFDDLKEAYDYPSFESSVDGKTLDGNGVSVAILISNDARDADIAAAFDHEKYTQRSGKPDPTITHLPLNGGAPFDINASFEASLDVQQVLGGAPGANVTLVNIPDLSDENIISGYLYIVEANAYDLVNSSFGGCELLYTAAYNGGQDYTGILKTYDELFAQGNAQGITFVASSGDEGGLLCPDTSYFSGSPTAKPKFVAGVSNPADSPHVTAVGGGNLVTTDSSTATGLAALKSAYVSENGLGDPEVPYDPYGLGINVRGGYWGAGGGVSSVFAAPSYQALVNTGSTTRRTLPDVGMQVGGCPEGLSRSCNATDSAAIVADGVGLENGGYFGVIGTSVSSPEFVGAVALYEQTAGRQGNLNYYLYSAGARQTARAGGPLAFRRPQTGFDGLYTAKQPSSGYDYIFGNGTPRVRNLFNMTTDAAAGIPQTKSNP